MRKRGNVVFIGGYTLKFNQGQIEVLNGVLPMAEVTFSVNLANITARRTVGSLNIHLYVMGIAKPFLTIDERKAVLQNASALEEYFVKKFMEIVALRGTITARDILIDIVPPYGHKINLKEKVLYGIA